jgi:hypothetical protein
MFITFAIVPPLNFEYQIIISQFFRKQEKGNRKIRKQEAGSGNRGAGGRQQKIGQNLMRP